MLETKSLIVAGVAFVLMFVGLYGEDANLANIPYWKTQVRPLHITHFVLAVSFWIFGACLMDSYDISNYRWAYEDRVAHGKEPFFDILQFAFHDASWSFDAFKVFWITIIAVLLYRGVKKYSCRPGSVMGLAMVTVLSGFITQMRSAMVGAIFLNTFPLLLSGKKRDRILYLVITLLSAQFHIAGYAYLIFLFVAPETRISFRKLYFIIIAAATIVSLAGTSFASTLISSAIRMIPFGGAGAARAMSYFRGEGSHFRYAVYLIIKHCIMFILTDRACDLLIANCDEADNASNRFRMIREANTLLLVFLPITLISASFERLFNCFALIQYAMVFNVGKSKFELSKTVFLSASIQSVLVTFSLAFTFIEWYFSPGDMVRILNSLEWIF